MPPDMYGYAYIRVYSYVLLSILKFAQNYEKKNHGWSVGRLDGNHDDLRSGYI
jgi:hypothetical protein